MRWHSSQRTTVSSGVDRITCSSALSMPSWQPVQRRWLMAAAPTPFLLARSLS